MSRVYFSTLCSESLIDWKVRHRPVCYAVKQYSPFKYILLTKLLSENASSPKYQRYSRDLRDHPIHPSAPETVTGRCFPVLFIKLCRSHHIFLNELVLNSLIHNLHFLYLSLFLLYTRRSTVTEWSKCWVNSLFFNAGLTSQSKKSLSFLQWYYLNTLTRPSSFSPFLQAVSNQFLILSLQTSCARICFLLTVVYLKDPLLHTCVHLYTELWIYSKFWCPEKAIKKWKFMNGHHESLWKLLCAATGILLGPANRKMLKNQQHGMNKHEGDELFSFSFLPADAQ